MMYGLWFHRRRSGDRLADLVLLALRLWLMGQLVAAVAGVVFFLMGRSVQ